MTGGGYYPAPQGQKALVRAFGLLRRDAPDLTAVVVTDPGACLVEIANAGDGDADDVEFALVDRTGAIVTASAGHLERGRSASVSIGAQLPSAESIECVWTCVDRRGRTHVWSHDGRRLRTRGRERLDARAALARMYPATSVTGPGV